MPRGSPGPADVDLAAAVSRLLERDISPRQIERWRERGLLPKLDKQGKGRGLGSTASYPVDALEHAAAIGRALDEFGRLDDAALACFVRGYVPREPGLRWAYKNSFTRLHKSLVRTAKSNDPWDIAEITGRLLARRAGRSTTARRMRTRLRDVEKGAMLADVFTNAMAVGLGTGARLHPEAFEAVGAMGIFNDRFGAVGPISDQPPQDAPDLSLQTLEEIATTSQLAELIAGRDDLLVLRDFSSAFASTTSRTLGLDFGFGSIADVLTDDLVAALIAIPWMLTIRRLAPDFEESIAFFRIETPRYEAHSRLLDALSEKHQRMVGAGAEGLGLLPDKERDEFSQAVRAWAEAHPDDMALIM